jgi:cystathionine gamma-synthase/methionine-gamma-lyase
MPGAIPSTTPIFTATSYAYEHMDDLEAAFAEEGYFYQRYGHPTNRALEEQVTSLEGAAGTIATASGMSAIQLAIQTALTDRRRSIVAANALYGVTMKMLHTILEPSGVEVTFVDVSDLDATAAVIAETRPGCVLVEAISNPLLRVAPLDKLAEMSRKVGAALVVDSTFATPLLMRPIELGAALAANSLTKNLAGHGDVIGGVVSSDEENWPVLRALSSTSGPLLGPFESYLAMRGIKTFPLRMERQCVNATEIAAWLAKHPRVSRVYFPGDDQHPDAETVRRLLPAGLYGSMVSFDLKDAGRAEVFAFMERLQLIVRGTSLGDVHSLMLYPAMASHRDVAPKQRLRMGIGDGLVRLSAGIEAVHDIIDDLDQALSASQ